MSGKRGLTDKQKIFVQEYPKDLNATQAAIRAGYSARTARQIGQENLSKPDIMTAIQAALLERQARTEITQDYVLEGLKTVVERSLEAVPVLDSEGCETGVWRFNAAGANKALELLGRHLGMFSDLNLNLNEPPRLEVVLRKGGGHEA